MSLLVSLLARLPQYNPTHLPFGYSGPQIQSHGWIEREALEQIGKQMVGLIWHDRQPEAVTRAVETAVSEAIRVGFMEQQQYDAWRPGMPSGSGWRSAVTATPYGITRARAVVESNSHDHEVPPGQRETVLEATAQVAKASAYHNIVEAVANSPIGWVGMELNGWYLQIVKAIEDLLALPEFADFPGGFEPVAPNLFPCSDLDVGWEDCIGPPVMDFLGWAQAYMLASGPVGPENQELVNAILEICSV